MPVFENFEYQFENPDTYQKFAEFDESFQTKCKELSLRENKEFWRNCLKASCAGFAEFTQNLV